MAIFELIAALAFGPWGQADLDPLLLAAIPVETAAGLDFSQPVYAQIDVKDPAALARALGGAVADDPGGPLRFALGREEPPQRPPTAAERAASFVVDFDQPSFAPIVEELDRASGPRPSIEELTAFVARAISHKTYARRWDVASRVARTRAGDCTEHAVLLTALARAHGYAARIVVGAALFAQRQRVGAFGHAWSEIHDGTRWVIADAALADFPVAPHYLRGAELRDESVGYTLGLIGLMDAVGIRHIALSNGDR